MQKQAILKSFTRLAYTNAVRFFVFSFLFGVDPLISIGQTCPVNIDFETGSFVGWTCYTGYVSGLGGQNIISLTPSNGPVPDRHTMYSSNPGDGVDEYGGFPKNCPNGSGHSIRLGNSLGGGEAEGISYEFNIPAGENIYNLIYNYAVVFQDPNHLEFQQPRMEIEITNVTDNQIISCSSFSFYPFGSPLPGFEVSPNPGSNTPVHFKKWSAVSINLDGNAGKRIRLFFKTSDCTFQRHFGYAYIDVNSECSSSFVGATFCHDDPQVEVTAPYGYQNYQWFNLAFTQLLGTSQILTYSPPPPPGTTVAVVLTPYNGYGCLDTLYATLIDTLHIKANAGSDVSSCNHALVPIGSPPKPGLLYEWSPVIALSNPNVANPLASPDITTTYILKTSSSGGGCVDFDTVVVKASNLNNNLEFFGKAEYCIGSGDSAVLKVQQTDSVQWYRNDVPIGGAHNNVYAVTQSGTYYAMVYNLEGCMLRTDSKVINISSVPVAGIGLDSAKQCLIGNRFTFNNTSTNAVGSMSYQWNFGDNTAETSASVVHTYTTAGVYTVKMLVNSSTVCMDSSTINIHVYQNAIADFSIAAACINLPAVVINRTIEPGTSPVNFNWVLGNGQTSTGRNPPTLSYAAAGTYNYRLSVNTDQCPTPLTVAIRNVVIEKPRPGILYADQGAVFNLPVTLQARAIGNSVVWNPPTFLDNANLFKPVFKGSEDQLYTIKITTPAGCEAVDTQFVKIYPNVEVFVPTAFTPNGDGKNDYLRPIVVGIKEIRSFRIYNRWGTLLFETKNERPGWDGKYKSAPQPTQTVVWQFDGIGADDRMYTKSGTCVLIK